MVDSCYCKILFLLLFFFSFKIEMRKKPTNFATECKSIDSAWCYPLFVFLMVFVPEKIHIWTVLRSIFYVPRLSIAFHFLCRYSISHLSHFARVYHVQMYAFFMLFRRFHRQLETYYVSFFFRVILLLLDQWVESFCFVAMDIFNGMASVYLSCCRKLLHFPCHSLVLCAF